MTTPHTLRKAWALFDSRERRNALLVLVIMIFAAASAAAMVFSVVPFLTVLGEPERIETSMLLSWLYELGGFQSDYDFLAALGIASFMVVLGASALQILRVWAMSRFIQMRIHSISYKLLEAYLRQPYTFFLKRHSGDMGTKILSEAQLVAQSFLGPFAQIVSGSLTTFAVIALLIWLNPLMALFVFVVLGGAYGLILFASRRAVTRLGRARADSNAKRFTVAGEALTSIKHVKVAGAERVYLHRYSAPSRLMARTVSKSAVLSQAPSFAIQAIAFGGMFSIIFMVLDETAFAEGQALGGLLPILGAFAFAGQRLMPEMQKIYSGLTQFRFAEAAIEDVYADLNIKRSGASLPDQQPANLRLNQDLRLNDLFYQYPNADKTSLSGITLKISVGEKIGIVGGTGAGKTTLADVILGLLNPLSGTITVDGVTISDANIRAWQRSLGYVPQDIVLTDATITENIAFGIPTNRIDHDKVRQAAAIAQLSSFIDNDTPSGYQTRIGERGVRLSGGQRQRIGIARALYHDPDLILFDEATSALDNLTEQEVMSAIERLPEDKTVIMIAHRLSTIRRCDRIVIIDDGRVAGIGTWDELALDNAKFRKLADAA